MPMVTTNIPATGELWPEKLWPEKLWPKRPWPEMPVAVVRTIMRANSLPKPVLAVKLLPPSNVGGGPPGRRGGRSFEFGLRLESQDPGRGAAGSAASPDESSR